MLGSTESAICALACLSKGMWPCTNCRASSLQLQQPCERYLCLAQPGQTQSLSLNKHAADIPEQNDHSLHLEQQHCSANRVVGRTGQKMSQLISLCLCMHEYCCSIPQEGMDSEACSTCMRIAALKKVANWALQSVPVRDGPVIICLIRFAWKLCPVEPLACRLNGSLAGPAKGQLKTALNDISKRGLYGSEVGGAQSSHARPTIAAGLVGPAAGEIQRCHLAAFEALGDTQHCWWQLQSCQLVPLCQAALERATSHDHRDSL